MSYNPNSLKGVISGSIIWVAKGESRSLDYGSYVLSFSIQRLRLRVWGFIHRALSRQSSKKAQDNQAQDNLISMPSVMAMREGPLRT